LRFCRACQKADRQTLPVFSSKKKLASQRGGRALDAHAGTSALPGARRHSVPVSNGGGGAAAPRRLCNEGLAAQGAKSAKPRQGIFVWGCKRERFRTSRLGKGTQRPASSPQFFRRVRGLTNPLAQGKVPVTIVTARAVPNLAVVSLCYEVQCSSQDRDWRGGFERAPRRCRARHGAAFSGAPAEARRRGAAAEERATSREPTAALRVTSRPFPRAQTPPTTTR
jgi:hypothetical protein